MTASKMGADVAVVEATRRRVLLATGGV